MSRNNGNRMAVLDQSRAASLPAAAVTPNRNFVNVAGEVFNIDAVSHISPVGMQDGKGRALEVFLVTGRTICLRAADADWFESLVESRCQKRA